MTNNFNQALIGIVGGCLMLALVAGAAFYLETQAKSSTVAATRITTYPTDGIRALIQSVTLIKRVGSLQEVPQSEPQAIQYSSGDLGRTDITKVE